MGCADPLLRGSAHPISVLELAKNEVDERGSSDVTYSGPNFGNGSKLFPCL